MDVFELLARQIHVLIGGRTGAGKSVCIAGILLHIMQHIPDARLILIDAKRVELYSFRQSRQCMLYADTAGSITAALQTACTIMDSRYSAMQSTGCKRTRDAPIYVIIDELADTLDICGKQAHIAIKRLLQLGRAANIHIIAATQHVARATLPADLQINFTAVCALPCRTAIESRQLIGTAAAADLDTGAAYITAPDIHAPRLVSLPMVSDADTAAAIQRQQDAQTAPPDAPGSKPAAVAPGGVPWALYIIGAIVCMCIACIKTVM